MNNPYAKFVDGKDPLAVVESTLPRVQAVIAALSADRIAQPIAPGKWTVHEIIAHLADCELVFQARCRWMMFEDNPTLISFDQDPWLTGWRREREPFAATLERYRVLRESTIRMFRAASGADLAKPGKHGQLGAMSSQGVMEVMAGHDLNHLGQLEAVAA